MLRVKSVIELTRGEWVCIIYCSLDLLLTLPKALFFAYAGTCVLRPCTFDEWDSCENRLVWNRSCFEQNLFFVVLSHCTVVCMMRCSVFITSSLATTHYATFFSLFLLPLSKRHYLIAKPPSTNVCLRVCTHKPSPLIPITLVDGACLHLYLTPSCVSSERKCEAPTFTSIIHRTDCWSSLSVNRNDTRLMCDETVPEANSVANLNLVRQCLVPVWWDDSVFLIKYWLFVGFGGIVMTMILTLLKKHTEGLLIMQILRSHSQRF